MLLKSFWASLPGQIIGLAGLVTAVTTLVNLLWRLYGAFWDRIGRPRTVTRIIRQLSCGVNIKVFEYHLGIPAQYVNVGTRGTNSRGDLLEYIFVLDYVYVQAVTELGKVICFSVTARRPAFHPVLEYYGAVSISLGKTTYQQLGHEPNGVYGWLGARRWGYGEAYYHGNPGGYQTYVYSINDAAGLESGVEFISAALGNVAIVSLGLFDDTGSLSADSALTEWLDDENVRELRLHGTMNTITVVGPHTDVKKIVDSGFGFGPDLDQVRLLPKP
jgi:hypothetical protein